METRLCYFFPLIFLNILNTLTPGHGSKILVYPNDLQGNAQFKSLVTIAETLAERHEVTLLTNSLVVPGSLSSNVKVVTYSLPDALALPEPGEDLLQPGVASNFFTLVRTVRIQTMLDICEALLKQQYIIIRLNMEEFDLIFADVTNICARILIDYLRIPTVAWCYDNYDITCDFSNDFVTMASSQDVLTRLRHTFKYLIHKGIYQSSVIVQPFDKLQHQYGYNRGLSVSDTFARNKPLVILNADFSVDMPRPLMPYVVPIAGLIFNKTDYLPHDIEDFIESSGSDGFIYVSLILQDSWFFQKQFTKILDTLTKFEKYVIVEEEIKVKMHFSGKLKSVSSGYHSAILGHEKLRLFITGCNHVAMHEMVYHNVPVIFLSSFGDTEYCVSFTERHGIGKVLDVLELSDLDVEKEIGSFLDIIKYEKSMGKLSNIFKHQIKNSRERLFQWIGFVSLNKGIESFHSNAASQPQWYQYGMLDLTILILLGAIVVLLSTVTVLFFVIKKLLQKLFGAKQVKYKME